MAAATSPKSLTDEEQRTWLAFARSSRLLFAQLERDLSRDAGMAPGSYELLMLLAAAPRHALRMNELAEATLSSPSRMTHAVERLVELGWVERTTCPSDRRGWLAVLTDAGGAALEATAPRHVEHLRTHLFDGLTEEDAADLRRICEGILARLPGGGAAGGCPGA